MPPATGTEPLEHPEYWNRLRQHLEATGPTPRTRPRIMLQRARLQHARAMQKELGWFRTRLALDRGLIDQCASLVQEVVSAGHPSSYALIYPELWKLITHPALRTLAQQLLGEPAFIRANPILHYVDRTVGHGWPPHADGMGYHYRDPQNRLLQTLWLPLTVATPENGCMFVLSRKASQAFWETMGEEERLNPGLLRACLHGVQPLPCLPGQVIGWGGETVHFGGQYCAGPARISLALEAQPVDCVLDEFSTTFAAPPSYEKRCAVIRRLRGEYAITDSNHSSSLWEHYTLTPHSEATSD